MRNGSCPLVFLCLFAEIVWKIQTLTYSCSINDFATDRKSLLTTSAVTFFGRSAEVERCPFVNTSRARHTDAILLSRSVSLWKYSFFYFSHKIVHVISYFLFCFAYCNLGKHLSLSLSLFLSLSL